MNSKVKRVLYIFLGLAVAIALIVGRFAIKLQSEFKKMKPVETQQINDQIYCIKDGTVNMYLVKDGDHYIAIDAGNDTVNILSGLKLLKISPELVSAVFLTHSDGDHVAGASLFANAEIYLPAGENSLVSGIKKRMLLIKNKIPVDKYTLIGDKRRIKVGTTEIKTISTPGHTPGHTAYLINGKFLFVGDMLSLNANRIGQENAFFHMDKDLAIRSLSNITGIRGVETVFTGHFGMVKYSEMLPYLTR